MKKQIFFVCLFLLQLFPCQGQIHIEIKKVNVDSLQQILPGLDGTDRIDALNKLSLALCRDLPDSSMALANQTIALSEKFDYQKGLADGYFNLGNNYFFMDSIKPMVLNYLNSIKIYEHLSPSLELGLVYFQLTLINKLIGRYDQAKYYCRKAIDIYQSIDEHKYRINAIYKMGRIFSYSSVWDSAFVYFDSAIILLKTYPDNWILAGVYNQYGMNYGLQFWEGNTDIELLYKSIPWYFKGWELDKKYHGEVEMTTPIYNIGASLISTGIEKNIQEGLEYIKIVKPISDTSTIKIHMKLLVYRRLAQNEYRKGNFKEAISLYKTGLSLAEDAMKKFSVKNYIDPQEAYIDKYHYKLNKQICYDDIYQIYYEVGDYKNALKYFSLKEKAAKDIYKVENARLITILETEMQNEQTKNQIALLEKENEVKSLSIKHSRTYIFALAGFLLILFFLTFLYFRQRKIRLEHNTLIREQKLLHDLELKNMESEKLKELDHLKSRFFANISHEFRTPLTLIMGPLEKVLSNTREDHNKKELGIVKKYAAKLQILINNLLTISKLESGKMELHASETDIVKLIRTFIQAFESLAKQKHITLSFSSEKKEIKAFIDREKFEQVLNNLLSNAFKFTDEGGKIAVLVTPLNPPSSGETHPTAVSNQSMVEIIISDTGCGISPEHINHIFDRFYQAGQENNSYYEGTGIGLALTKELVELHHGQINVESKKGEGSTFTILLPLGKEHLKPEEIAIDKPEQIITPTITHVLPESEEESITISKGISENK